ncbi:glycerophosphocholine acyltransferase 1-like [Branchiostoma floridae]|uniref:Glycerophosphocholine acyltransferase 1 n=1 Tax=Branchiostoma floridae TaxID=7739 RepID=A0A9J7MLR7_BRAFL|nr:glycerophosphocholine acyltransferase 1-like [Branchiostoma floridae]
MFGKEKSKSSDLELIVDDLEMEAEREGSFSGELQGRKDNRVAPAVLSSSNGVLPQNGSSPAKTSAVANGTACSNGDVNGVLNNSEGRQDRTRLDAGKLQRASSTLSNQVPDDKAMEDDVRNFLKNLAKNRLREKVFYVAAVCSLVVVAFGLLALQWLIPYYYAVSAPVLIGLRLYLYCTKKWQFFMLDFCYFGNAITYVYIWAAPADPRMFQVTFAIANGPLVIAVFFFRNSIVFHSIDRMTSVFIHSLPAYVAYGVRWYSPETSVNWYTPFPTETEFQNPSFIWLLAVPLACYVGHALLYAIVVNGILRPSPEYWNSYRFLTAKKNGVVYKALNMFGPKFLYFNYNVLNVLVCLASILLCQVWYRWFVAHAVFLAVAFVIKAWNGATFYMDVFSQGKSVSDWD